MRESWLKQAVRRCFFPTGAIRRVRFGPLRGTRFRVGPVTGLSPWYSGVERSHQRVFQGFVHAGDVAVDVGASWGVHSILLSRLVGPEGRVLAMEPLPEAFAELDWHLQANGCRNVTAFSIALSDREGEAAFQPGDSPSTSRLGVEGSLRVRTRTLDSVVDEAKLNRLRLVKIDVEGAEGRVLRGAKRTLDRFHPMCIVDVHTSDQGSEVADLLQASGYRLAHLSGELIVRVGDRWPEPLGEWEFILGLPPGYADRL